MIPTQQIVLITGMGGAGKTTALHTLEDLGFYCVDNLPPVLLPKLLDLLAPHESIRRVAAGFDIRDNVFFGRSPETLSGMIADGLNPETVFLDADNEVLKRRYKETRRAHPLDREGAGLDAAIALEREMLEIIRPLVNTRIDTSAMSPHALRALIRSRYGAGPQTMHVSVTSFGYKFGTPPDADMIFDARFLKNPFFVPELSHLTGLDNAVASYVMSDPDARSFADRIMDMMEFLIPKYSAEGKHYLTVAIGCTGGQHRSVSLAEMIGRELAGRLPENCVLDIRHRELKK